MAPVTAGASPVTGVRRLPCPSKSQHFCGCDVVTAVTAVFHHHYVGEIHIFPARSPMHGSPMWATLKSGVTSRHTSRSAIFLAVTQPSQGVTGTSQGRAAAAAPHAQCPRHEAY